MGSSDFSNIHRIRRKQEQNFNDMQGYFVNGEELWSELYNCNYVSVSYDKFILLLIPETVWSLLPSIWKISFF